MQIPTAGRGCQMLQTLLLQYKFPAKSCRLNDTRRHTFTSGPAQVVAKRARLEALPEAVHVWRRFARHRK